MIAQSKIEFPSGALTDEDKMEITILIKEAIAQLGTAAAVASRCSISDATISLIAKNQYNTQGEDMWRKIAAALGWNKNSWNLVEDTTNTRTMLQVLSDAQTQSIFLGISERAGAGKSSGIRKYLEKAKANNVFYLECWNWGPKLLLTKIYTVTGQPLPKGTFSVNDMLDTIIHYFHMRKGKPLLILDQANSLPHQSLILLIHIYNQLQGRIGCVLAGTENLELKIERGVKNRHMGYDELDDRLGRTYIHLPGYTLGDVRKICAANGIKDEDQQKKIFHECGPINKTIQSGAQSQNVKIIESGRVLQRKIVKYTMLATLEKQAI